MNSTSGNKKLLRFIRQKIKLESTKSSMIAADSNKWASHGISRKHKNFFALSC